MDTATQFLIVIGAILLFAIAADIIGQRTFLPRVTLLILFGIAIGQDGLDLVPKFIANQFEIVANIALLMVGFLIGGTLSRKAMRGIVGTTLWIAAVAAVLTVGIVMICLTTIGIARDLAVLLGCIAAATGPAVTLDVIAESNHKGPFEQLLISVVAVDDAIGLLLFSIGIAFAVAFNGSELGSNPILEASYELGGAVVLGVIVGVPAAYLTGRLRPGQPILVEALAVVFLCGGLALWLHVSFLIAAIVVGAVIVNFAKHHDYPFHAIEGIEWVFLIIFFTLAGASLDLQTLTQFGLLAVVYFFSRVAGKLIGGYAGGYFSRADNITRRWIGPALLPQAGVAVGMALVAANEFPQHAQILLSVVVSTTIVFEILGPVSTRFALRQVNKR